MKNTAARIERLEQITNPPKPPVYVVKYPESGLMFLASKPVTAADIAEMEKTNQVVIFSVTYSGERSHEAAEHPQD
jgi:hypothetical protein